MAKDFPTTLAAGLLGLLFAAAAGAAGAASPGEDGGAGGAPQGMPYPPSIEQVFEMLDADHDGIVVLAEALKGVGQHFDQVDQNRDGTLDKAEFDSWFGRANPEAARFFLSLYDIDGDGKVTRAEFESPVKKRFALFDRNDDGKVTPDEVRFARMLMTGGPTALLVPPMSGASGAAAPANPAAPAPPIVPLRPAQPMSQYPSGPVQQQIPQMAPPQMPQTFAPAPGVYGPGGQNWNPQGGPGRPMFQGGSGRLYGPQGPLR
ncbi:MAG: EF-hand domain-containing protein [Siculibacillus sp.]|nr:EF-hand domain-containing protein [Siculibacillus sp.]